MSFHGRSLDDLPLAAYTTGVAPDETESLDSDVDPDLVTPPAQTQQELAAALAEQVAAATPTQEKASRRPRLSLKVPTPKVSTPKLPSLRRSKAAALQQAAPFQPAGTGASPAPSFQPVASFQAAPAFEPVNRPGPAPQPGQPAARAAKRRAGLSLRDPRLLAGGIIVIGLALLGMSLLGGGGPATGSTGPNSSQGSGGLVPSAAPGVASVELTGTASTIFTLTGATGAGAPVDSQLKATWTDLLGESLGITGLASQGTRATDPNFVLSWTMLIDNQPVTFTSRASECTIGMAVAPRAVHGTFVCKKLRSGDGKHEIDFRGAYTT